MRKNNSLSLLVSAVISAVLILQGTSSITADGAATYLSAYSVTNNTSAGFKYDNSDCYVADCLKKDSLV